MKLDERALNTQEGTDKFTQNRLREAWREENIKKKLVWNLVKVERD
jgi:hypothetical protein